MRSLRYLSVCSGIEAATQAFRPLGWTPVAFSEIEPFSCAVLTHHYPDVPNWGDMTKFKDWPSANIDVVCGGTPCQSFSIAGLRQGMADPRGNLMLTFGAIAARYQSRWLVWENVPGVLSSNRGRDFAAFLTLLGQLGYGWAYRVLDAQYVRTRMFRGAVPQRRRRVFLIGYLGDWRRAAAVLFDRESLSGDSPPRRETGQGAARGFETSVNGRGNETRSNHASTGDVSHCLNAGAMGRLDYESETIVVHTLRGEGFNASEDGSGRGTPLVAYPLMAAMHKSASRMPHEQGALVPILFDCTGTEVQFNDNGAANTIRQSNAHSAIATGWAVRRLTPRECERLQGFPDDFTRIPYRGKPADKCPDGPRYKSIGNSWAVNCAEWIGGRISDVDGWGKAA